jgi:hypothetical protein
MLTKMRRESDRSIDSVMNEEVRWNEVSCFCKRIHPTAILCAQRLLKMCAMRALDPSNAIIHDTATKRATSRVLSLHLLFSLFVDSSILIHL